jgi:hypothetical protein
MLAGVLMSLVATYASSPGSQSPPAGAPIRTEFRVFDGAAEVTGETRIRVRPTGANEPGTVIEGARLMLELPAGIYDAQAIHHRDGRVLNVRWAERLVVMPYPDEAGQHLEVINFSPQFGALQLRLPDGSRTEDAAVSVRAQESGAPVPAVKPAIGDGYLLVVLPGGTYSFQITLPGQDPVLLSALEIPADRTRMIVVKPTGR